MLDDGDAGNRGVFNGMSSQFSIASPDVFAPQESTKAATRLRAIVVGGSGQIGGWLLRHLTARGHHGIGTYASRAFPGLIQLDAADADAAADLIRKEKPDVVFYPAGFTWVDGCERDKAKAYSANLEQPLNVAKTAADVGARFVYFSTDYVFDGVHGPYSEDSPTNPLSIYGQAKHDAEASLANALGDRLLTVRTCWVYGPERQGKNFSYQLVRHSSEQADDASERPGLQPQLRTGRREGGCAFDRGRRFGLDQRRGPGDRRPRPVRPRGRPRLRS